MLKAARVAAQSPPELGPVVGAWLGWLAVSLRLSNTQDQTGEGDLAAVERANAAVLDYDLEAALHSLAALKGKETARVVADWRKDAANCAKRAQARALLDARAALVAASRSES